MVNDRRNFVRQDIGSIRGSIQGDVAVLAVAIVSLVVSSSGTPIAAIIAGALDISVLVNLIGLSGKLKRL